MTTYTIRRMRAGHYVLGTLAALTLIALMLSMTPLQTSAQTMPTSPTIPTAPTSPQSSTEPATPGNPTNPTTPSDPTCPTAPTNPTPTNGSSTPTVHCDTTGGGGNNGGGTGSTTPQYKVHILKYLQNGSSTMQIPNTSTSTVLFPMESTWTAGNLNGGATTTGTFWLGSFFGGSSMRYGADTAFMDAGASYMAHEVSSAMASSSSVIGVGGTCVAGQYRTVGYRSGTSVSAAEGASLQTTAPQFSNLGSDQYLIVINEYCTTDGMPGGGDNGGGNGTTTPPTNNATTTVTIHYSDLAQNSGDTSGKWFFWNDSNVDTTLGSDTFVTGPGTAPLGSGSVILTSNGAMRHSLSTTQYGGVRLADIRDLSFSTYTNETMNGSSTATTTSPFLSFNVDLQGNGTGTGELIFRPNHNGSVATSTWQNWDAVGSGQWTWSGYASTSTSTPNNWPDANTNEYRSWSSLVSAFPNSRISSSSPLLGFSIMSADASTTAQAYLDNVSITLASTTTASSTDTTVYDFEPTQNSGGNSGGGGGGGGSSHHSSSNSTSSGGVGGDGSVLGAACPLITSWMRMGQYNDPNQVTLLQSFLNDEMNDHLDTSGIFDVATTNVVNAFQVKYWDDVLSPWVAYGLPTDHTPTGYVYKTTSYKINQIACPDLTFAAPVLP